ncbi:MAG TPA: S8 family serine peptidase [Bacteroidota bacterium]
MTTLQRILALVVIVSSFGPPAELAAQSTAHQSFWVYLTQRSPVNLPAKVLGISERALVRRAKVLPADRLIDQYDAPIPVSVIDQIRGTGATVRTVSRWLNAVSVNATADQLAAIASLVPVSSTAPVVDLHFRKPQASTQPSAVSHRALDKTTLFSYGPSFDQLNTINIIPLHEMGINGTGVLLGMLDDGFNNHTTHAALKNIRVVAEYDFVQQDFNTSLAPGENPEQGIHGAGTLSSIAGFASGTLVGGAFGVSVVLAKTEIDSVEIHLEEDNYVAALEWMERLGVDIASSSLGYRDFDTTTYSYTYSQLDGHSTIAAKAATIAAQKGLLLVTAMGNEGRQTGTSSFLLGTIVTPADADSIIAVGAASLDGTTLAGFSGVGPTSDGRTKPEVVAPGINVWWVFGNSTSDYWRVNGTSAATPLTASAAALLLSAHPELTPMQIRQALMNTAIPLSGLSAALSIPNNYEGYGLVDAYDAVLGVGLAFSNLPIVTANDTAYRVTTWISSKSTLDASSLAFYYRYPSDSLFTRVALLPGRNAHEYSASIPKPPTGVIPVGYFTATDAAGQRTSPFDAPNHFFTIQPSSDSLRQFFPPVDSVPPAVLLPTDYVLSNNYPNPFNSTTTIRFYAPTTARVELVVYNLLGQRVKSLFSGTPAPGWNPVRWNDTKDDAGHSISSGVYFARLTTNHSALTVKLLYLK